MIEDAIHITNKYQFEIKLGYQLESRKKATTYDVETYLFFPDSLGINRHTYSKKKFYKDIQTYIRLRTPMVLLNTIVNEKNSPLEKIQVSIDRLLSRVNETNFANYEFHVKMFCCILKSSLRDHVDFMATRQNVSDIQDLLCKYIECVQEITKSFRALRFKLNVPTINHSIFSVFLFADEYVSLLIESQTYALLEYTKTITTFEKDEYTKKIFALITKELEYRKLNNYPSIPLADSSNEEFVFRAGVLKKFMKNVLFLNTRFKQEGEIAEQMSFAMAAGIAMIFATGTIFLVQSVYSNLSMPVFIALVISYMFKDRIKELTRGYLWGKLRHLFFDHKMNIYYNLKMKLGWCKEVFAFLKEKDIPKDILEIRDRSHITEIENGSMGEKTILYKKRIKLFPKNLDCVFVDYPQESVVDIMRLNILSFLSKMDNPDKPLFVNDGMEYQKQFGKRVYHMNMITKYSIKNDVNYKRFRIILNRNGIERIEEVIV